MGPMIRAPPLAARASSVAGDAYFYRSLAPSTKPEQCPEALLLEVAIIREGFGQTFMAHHFH